MNISIFLGVERRYEGSNNGGPNDGGQRGHSFLRDVPICFLRSGTAQARGMETKFTAATFLSARQTVSVREKTSP